jgi:hypothetical protein
MLKHARSFKPITLVLVILLALLLGSCGKQEQTATKTEPADKVGIFEGGDDSPITIADGSLDIFSRATLQIVSSSTTQVTFNLPANHSFHRLLDENSLLIEDISAGPWTLTIMPHNATITSSNDATSFTVTANSGTLTVSEPGTVAGYKYATVIHDSDTRHIQSVTLSVNSGPAIPVTCTAKVSGGPCHIILSACHTSGCT